MKQLVMKHRLETRAMKHRLETRAMKHRLAAPDSAMLEWIEQGRGSVPALVDRSRREQRG
jgi:hypothetical protein